MYNITNIVYPSALHNYSNRVQFGSLQYNHYNIEVNQIGLASSPIMGEAIRPKIRSWMQIKSQSQWSES